MLTTLSASDLLTIFIAIIISMAIHEAMHGFIAHWLGDRTAADMGRLTLNPLKHIDIFTTVLLPILLILFHVPPFFAAKPVPFNPENLRFGDFGSALVGLAGPFTNLGLAIFASLFLRIFHIAIGTEFFNILDLFIQVNIGFFVFNMIPIPPLDGSRLLYAFAPEGVQRVMYQFESMGFMAILLFMLILFPYISPLIGNISQSIFTILLR